MVMIFSSFFSWYQLPLTAMFGISQPLRSIYIRSVINVQETIEERSKVWGSGPASLPPEAGGSSAINFPFLHSMVNLYFSIPLMTCKGFSNLYCMSKRYYLSRKFPKDPKQ